MSNARDEFITCIVHDLLVRVDAVILSLYVKQNTVSFAASKMIESLSDEVEVI